MRFGFLVVATFALFANLACSSADAPVAPDSTLADLPSWECTIDGETYFYGLEGLLDDRNLAVVEPGTDMNADELRVYFAVLLTETYFPENLWHTVYNYYVYPVMAAQPDEEVYSWVVIFEMNGEDVPNGPPPDPL